MDQDTPANSQPNNSSQQASQPKESNNKDGFGRLAVAVESLVKQERWSRRFANFLKLAVAAYIIFFIYLATDKMNSSAKLESMSMNQDHLAVVKLNGAIMPDSKISAETLNPLLNKAFTSPSSKAVVVLANSPGGSPVQSALINDEITRLKKKHQKPVYVVVEDVCASGCYYIAVAADKIFANAGSMVGSIGVRMDTFGVTGLMDKIGIENRSMHAGDHKTFIDPFSEKDEAGRQFFQEHILERTHQQFIQAVRKGRGDRIQENENTYSGLVWLGDEAVEKGLIDELGSLGSVARNIAETDNIRYYETDKTVFEQLMGDISTQTASKLALFLSTMR